MDDESFNRLLNGPLYHEYPAFRISRLALALRAVVDACGPVGERALQQYCEHRDYWKYWTEEKPQQ